MANEVELCNKSCLEVMKEIPDNIKDTIITDQIFFHQKECIKKLHVHHIDYDKNNINPNNLITLFRMTTSTKSY